MILDPHEWMSIAEKEIGVKETPSINTSNERIEMYHSFTDLGRAPEDYAWCSSAMCYVFESAGIKSTRDTAASSWRMWGEPCQARYGAILVWDHHVGLYVYQDRRNYWVLGGNQADEFRVSAFKKTNVIAIRAPGLDDLIKEK